MSLAVTLTGTDGVQLVPTFGYDCAACQRTHLQAQYRRRPCSGVVRFNNAVTLLNAGIPRLIDSWPAGNFQQFLLAHYHMDHAQGLFPSRQGVRATIPVYGPPDEQGYDDLFKYPGILDFNHTIAPFVVSDLQGLQVTPLSFNHSKPAFGYLLETAHSRVMWLSDTARLPNKTLKLLHDNQPQVAIIGYSHIPRAEPPRNRYDLDTIITLNDVIHCPRVIPTHINHQFDLWIMEHPLPVGFEAGYDGMGIVLEQGSLPDVMKTSYPTCKQMIKQLFLRQCLAAQQDL